MNGSIKETGQRGKKETLKIKVFPSHSNGNKVPFFRRTNELKKSYSKMHM